MLMLQIKIDYDKNIITKIANNDTFGAFILIFLQGMRISSYINKKQTST